LYGNDWPPFGYTMIGKKRLEQFRAAIHEVDRNDIKGAIIEMGVWRGGAMIMAATVTKEARSGRDLYLYDAFESIPAYGNSISFLENSEEDVRNYFRLFSLLDENIHFIKVYLRTRALMGERYFNCSSEN
jgi:O-methyltransferase